MKIHNYNFQILSVNSALLESPGTAYQSKLNINRIYKIATEFDEFLANEPKVSFRNGHYYVLDGQNTIAARKLLNGGNDLPIQCKVFYNLTESDEALLFARQAGTNPGARFQALVCGGDRDAVEFLRLTENMGLRIDYKQTRGAGQLACISTAFDLYRKAGSQTYQKAMHLLIDSWNGAPDSLQADLIHSMVEFVRLYDGEYNRNRLVPRLRKIEPAMLIREGKAVTAYTGYKRYLYLLYMIYNASPTKNPLPLKF
ncbi:DUF6551 family protein [Enterocloster lavalensis]|uniref:DUF6551 family protein n=1 Tax=Enterocloster lavalensis TaxID=460384 RepID=UPI0023F0C7B6|nr:DUF6551 family protein [Enterocloster lavalensis]